MNRRTRTLLALGPLLLVLSAATSVTGIAAASAPSSAPGSVRGHPAVVETRAIGRTVQGRAIMGWRLGQPTARTKVVILAAMHGDETGPSRILQNLRDGRAIRGADIWVVPAYNRDGIALHRRTNAHRVDLNRNYPYHWVRLTGTYYSGPRGGSEPETKAIMAFLRQVRPRYVVSFHQPLYGVGRAGPKGAAFVQRLHRQLHLPVKSFNCSGVCHGTMTDWFNHYFPGVAVTVEYGRGVSARQAAVTGPTGLLRAVGATR